MYERRRATFSTSNVRKERNKYFLVENALSRARSLINLIDCEQNVAALFCHVLRKHRAHVSLIENLYSLECLCRRDEDIVDGCGNGER